MGVVPFYTHVQSCEVHTEPHLAVQLGNNHHAYIPSVGCSTLAMTLRFPIHWSFCFTGSTKGMGPFGGWITQMVSIHPEAEQCTHPHHLKRGGHVCGMAISSTLQTIRSFQFGGGWTNPAPLPPCSIHN